MGRVNPLHTYFWSHQDVLIVVRARSVAEARDIVQKSMVLRGLEVPDEIATETPTLLAPRGIVWCYS